MTASSPFAELLDHLSISTQEASLLGDISPAAVSQAKAGSRIPDRLLERLAKVHAIDPEEMQNRQSSWRHRRAVEIGARVSTRCMAGACNK